MAEDDKTCLIEQVNFGEGMKYLPDTNLLKDPKGEQVIQYRKAKRFLKILTPELAMHTLQVDNCKTIAEIMDDICKKLQIPNNKESSLAFRTNKAEEEALDKDDERIKRQMRTLQEKKNLHTEAEGSNH